MASDLVLLCLPMSHNARLIWVNVCINHSWWDKKIHLEPQQTLVPKNSFSTEFLKWNHRDDDLGHSILVTKNPLYSDGFSLTY